MDVWIKIKVEWRRWIMDEEEHKEQEKQEEVDEVEDEEEN